MGDISHYYENITKNHLRKVMVLVAGDLSV